MNQMNLMKRIHGFGRVNLFCGPFGVKNSYKTNCNGCFWADSGSLRFIRFINSDCNGGFNEPNEH